MKKTLLSAFLSVFVILALWYVLSLSLDSPLILPGITDSAKAFAACITSKQFLQSLGTTFLRCLTALFFATVLGFLTGLASGTSSFLKTFFSLPLWILKATPVVSLILLSLFWFKASEIPAFVATLMALPVMAAATQKGIQATDGSMTEAARIYGLTKTQEIKFIYIPNLAPFFTQGLSSSYGLIWKAVAAGEVLSLPKRGMGTLLNTYQVHLETAYVVAATVTLILAGFLSEALFTLCVKCIKKLIKKNRISFWHFSDTTKPYPSDASLGIENLNFSYGEKVILKDFSLTVRQNGITAIMAKSGKGKTTLLNVIAHQLKKQGRPVSYVFQEPRLLPQLTVLENVLVPLCSVMTKQDALKTAERFIQKADLADLKDKVPSELSGGERQRASLARAFAYPSAVLLMDEAFQSQDLEKEIKLLLLLQKLLDENPRTCIFVTHSAREACTVSEKIFILDGNPLTVQKEILTGEKNSDFKTAYLFPQKQMLDAEEEINKTLLG